MNNDDKGGNWQWDQGWEDQKDVRGEVWRTPDRLVFEGLFPILMGALLWERTAWATVGTQLPQDPSKHPSVSLPSLCDLIPHRFPTACQSFSPTIKMVRGFSLAWIPFTFHRVVGIYFAWSCRIEATFWWGRVEVNTSVKTMADAVARYKFTMASSLSSNCQQHQRASGEPSAKMRGGGGDERRRKAAEFVTVSITLQKNLPGSLAWQISPAPRGGSASVKQELLLWGT